MKIKHPASHQSQNQNREELTIYKKVNELYVELVSLASPDKVSTLYNDRPSKSSPVRHIAREEEEETA